MRLGPEPVLAGWTVAFEALLAAVALSLGRDLTARLMGPAAGRVELAGYGLLLGLAVAAARGLGYDWESLGLGRDRLLPRLGGGVLLALLLTLPAAKHGVVPVLALRALPLALAVAAIEELLFRGVLLAVTRDAFGTVPALGLTSAAFALAHAAIYPWPALVLGFLAAMLLGVWRLTLHDLVAPTIAHAIADAVAAGALAG